MESPLDLRGALTKFEWAQQHSRVLKRDIIGWANLDTERPVTFRREFVSRGSRVDFWVETVRPPPHRWGLLVGDILNNFRGSLDYLARELVIAGREPEKKDSTRVKFPYSDKGRSKFLRVVCPDHLPGVNRAIYRTLSPFQPYRGRPWDHPSRALALLFQLSGREKHRELVATVIRPYVFGFRSPGGTRIRIVPVGPGEPFQPNTKVVSIPLLPLPGEFEPDVSVDFDASEHVALEDGPYLLPALRQIEGAVGQVLGKFI
jgi:hypothetical protein